PADVPGGSAVLIGARVVQGTARERRGCRHDSAASDTARTGTGPRQYGADGSAAREEKAAADVRHAAATAGGLGMSGSYVVVTPARDEEKTVERTIESMIAETGRPLRWGIVDAGSTDATRALVEKHLASNPWIELLVRGDRGFRALGGGVVDAF